MLVSSGPLPCDELSWEVKFDGFRCTALLDGVAGRLRLATRSGRYVENAVPELWPLLDVFAGRQVVLDGELVAGDGLPDSFYRIAPRLAACRPGSVARGRRLSPLTLVVFDLPWLDGRDLGSEPYWRRRELLAGMALEGPHWATSRTYHDGNELFVACETLGAEGVVAKAWESGYAAGMRSPSWVKRKCTRWRLDHAPRRRPGGAGVAFAR
jgi:bifunctional non-homologous end joining protein LigD